MMNNKFKKLFEIIDNFLINNDIKRNEWNLLNNWPELKWNDKINKEVYSILFLIEELDFHLEENNNKYFFKTSFGLNDFINEIKIILNNNNIFFNDKIRSIIWFCSNGTYFTPHWANQSIKRL